MFGLKIVMPLIVLSLYRKKALRIMNFQPQNSHTSPLFRKASVLKLKNKINLENILFISKSINNLLPSLFSFPLINTSIIPHGLLMINSKNIHTELHLGKNLIAISAVES